MTRQEKDMRAPFRVDGADCDWDEFVQWDDDESELYAELDEMSDILDADEEYYLDDA